MQSVIFYLVLGAEEEQRVGRRRRRPTLGPGQQQRPRPVVDDARGARARPRQSRVRARPVDRWRARFDPVQGRRRGHLCVQGHRGRRSRRLRPPGRRQDTGRQRDFDRGRGPLRDRGRFEERRTRVAVARSSGGPRRHGEKIWNDQVSLSIKR